MNSVSPVESRSDNLLANFQRNIRPREMFRVRHQLLALRASREAHGTAKFLTVSRTGVHFCYYFFRLMFFAAFVSSD